MFLTVKQNTIPDFLSALGFIAPKGLDMSYIIAPTTISNNAIDTLTNSGFTESPIEQISKDQDVKYLKKDPTLSYSFSAQNRVTTDPELLSAEFPKQPSVPEPGLYEPTTIKNNYKAIQIVEAANPYGGKSYLLKENFCGLPRNTLFAFSKGVK